MGPDTRAGDVEALGGVMEGSPKVCDLCTGIGLEAHGILSTGQVRQRQRGTRLDRELLNERRRVLPPANSQDH